MAGIRLDKCLAEMQLGSRSQVKEYIRAGKVMVNGKTVTTADEKVNPKLDKIFFEGREIGYQKFEYYMLNKPMGVLSATRDDRTKTVLDLITDNKRKDLFPVGRLDKDTEGLLLITNDGLLAHNLLSPKKHVDKTYYAKVDGRVGRKHIAEFQSGIIFSDGTKTLPAKLNILKEDEESEIELTIQEGKYHQVKRMFMAVGMRVLYLKRISMGTLTLDQTLNPGDYRRLTEEELNELKDVKGEDVYVSEC